MHEDRITKLKKKELFKGLDDKQLTFLAALEDFLARYHDHKVIGEFVFAHGLVAEVAKLKPGEQACFLVRLGNQEVTLAIRRPSPEEKYPQVHNTAWACLCDNGQGECELNPCPCPC